MALKRLLHTEQIARPIHKLHCSVVARVVMIRVRRCPSRSRGQLPLTGGFNTGGRIEEGERNERDAGGAGSSGKSTEAVDLEGRRAGAGRVGGAGGDWGAEGDGEKGEEGGDEEVHLCGGCGEVENGGMD